MVGTDEGYGARFEFDGRGFPRPLPCLRLSRLVLRSEVEVEVGFWPICEGRGFWPGRGCRFLGLCILFC